MKTPYIRQASTLVTVCVGCGHEIPLAKQRANKKFCTSLCRANTHNQKQRKLISDLQKENEDLRARLRALNVAYPVH